MTERHCPECGVFLEKPRSRPDHNRFFAIIERAFENWPETSEFQPRNPEHLRAYLTFQAGHINAVPIRLSEDATAREDYRATVEEVAGALIGESGYFELRVSAAGLDVIKPRSINYRTVSHKEFQQIRDAICGQIESALGINDCEMLLRNRAA